MVALKAGGHKYKVTRCLVMLKWQGAEVQLARIDVGKKYKFIETDNLPADTVPGILIYQYPFHAYLPVPGTIIDMMESETT